MLLLIRTGRSVLQPTPLIQTITNQLMSSLNPNPEEKMQQREANSGTQKVGADHDIEGTVNYFESVGSKNKLSPIIQRNRAYSEPRGPHRDALPRSPSPANPSPRLNRLITDYRATSSAPVLIRTKALPSRSSPTSPKKTTKYGTPPPSRPAPPPPARCIDKEKDRIKIPDLLNLRIHPFQSHGHFSREQRKKSCLHYLQGHFQLLLLENTGFLQMCLTIILLVIRGKIQRREVKKPSKILVCTNQSFIEILTMSQGN